MVGQEDIDWYRLYGPWEALEPAAVQELLAGFRKPWWVVGGHAIEAFTGVVREHEDIDISMFGRDVRFLREHLDGRYHLWSQNEGTLRPINQFFPEPLDYSSQIWIREHSLAPWIIDIPLSSDVDGRWRSKRDESHVADLDDVTWLHRDGVRYANPEIVLLYKALKTRPKDDRDLKAAWPLLSQGQQGWLLDSVRRIHPGHPWTQRLAMAPHDRR